MVDENCRFGVDVGFWLAVNIFPSCSETISTCQSPVLKHLASVKAPFAFCYTCTAAYVLPPTLCIIIRCAIICRVASSSWSNGRARKEGNTLQSGQAFCSGITVHFLLHQQMRGHVCSATDRPDSLDTRTSIASRVCWFETCLQDPLQDIQAACLTPSSSLSL